LNKVEDVPEWSKGPVRRPVDIGDSFHNSGMVLITDLKSDKYLDQSNKRKNKTQDNNEKNET